MLIFFKLDLDSGNGEIEVDTSLRRQTMNGFGGAWTDSVAWLVSQLSEKTRQNFIDTYYSKDWG